MTMCGVRLTIASAIWLGLLPSAGVSSQDDKKAEKKADKSKPAETHHDPMTLRIKLEAEGLTTLPGGSTVDIKSDDTVAGHDCQGITQSRPLDQNGKVSFKQVAACKVILTISITSFRTGRATVDLAEYKESLMYIQIKSSGETVVKAAPPP